MPVTMKCVVAVVLLFCAIGIASADDGNETAANNTIPAVSLDKIMEELYVMSAGWLKWIVLLVLVFGGICYAASRSEESRASGASHIKNAIQAVVMVMVGIWLVNWLYTLA